MDTMYTNSSNMFSWNKAIILSIGVGLLAVCLSISLQSRSEIVQHMLSGGMTLVATNTAVGSDHARLGSGASFETPGKPVQLIIPAIGVNAHIESTGLAWQNNGAMGVPTNFADVAWYNGGPVPGMPGSAVIDGHLDGKNVPQAVFYNLGKLKVGDLVEVVDTKGTTLQFRVVTTKTYAYDATTTDIFAGDSSKARLNLITCGGSWMKDKKLYDQRIVVFTELVSR